MKSKLAQNLTRIRRSKGISQEKLAELAGVSRRTIAYYETEDSKSQVENVFAIAKALNVKMEDLIGEPSQNNSSGSNSLQIDARSVEKIKMILALPKAKRSMLYAIAEAFTNQKDEKTEKPTEKDDKE